MTLMLAVAMATAVTAGWENVKPDRREFPLTEIVWRAPTEGLKVEKEDGAEGEVTFGGGVITVRKTNDRGRIVVTAPAFKVEKGRELRFFADVTSSSANYLAASGMLCAWDRKRTLAWGDKIGCRWFAQGGEHMWKLVNSAPGTTYRKYRHLASETGEITAAFVVSGEPSVSTWRNWAAEDLNCAQAAWDRHFEKLNAPDRSCDLQADADFDRALSADIDHTARIVNRDGFAKLEVDGRVVPPILYKACEWTVEGRVNYAGKPLQAAGVTIGVMNIRLGDLGFSPYRGPWSERGFDVKAAAAKVRESMRVGDKSLFIIALGTSAYPAFTEKEHPDEVWIKKDGTVARGNSGSVTPDTYNDGGKPDPGDRRWPWVSQASPSWRAAIKRVTGELFAELRRQGLMKRVIGVHFYGYHDGQFAMPILDYSPCVKAAHREYLAKNGIKESDPRGNFEYFSKQLGFLALEDFSREAKRLAGKPILAVKWEMSSFNISFDVGSFINSDTVDVMIPQINYLRRLPALAQGLNAPTASLHRHNKMLWLEFDLRTYAALDRWALSLVAQKGMNGAEDIEMWRTMIRKNAGVLNASRMGWWMYDMAGGWYYPPEIVEDFKGVYGMRRELEALAKPDPWHPDVAFVVDEEAMANYNTPYGPKVKVPVTLATLQWPKFGASGVPYESYVAEDFYAHPELAAKYKAIALAGFVSPSEKQRGLIAAIERQGVKTVTVQPNGLAPKAFNEFARSAGAFVACEADKLEVDMNGDFLSVHCLVGGEYDVKLPRRCTAVNAKDGSTATGDSLHLKLTPGETCWFRLKQ